jgi:hypothetical protein
MASIQEVFEYASLANAAYVRLDATNWSQSEAVRNAAEAQERLPRTLGDATFVSSPDGVWRVVHPHEADNAVTGFAATLFERNDKYVLAIRGTEPDGSPFSLGTQTSLDLVRADIAEIGLLGMSLTQR